MSNHSKLPPSSAARRVACPGSRALEELFPEEQDSPEAREGHAAHWVAKEFITTGLIPNLMAVAPNGECVTQEMIEGAKLYVEALNQSIGIHTVLHFFNNPSSGVRECAIEKPISISNIHPDCWGTPDFWYFNNSDRDLFVFDYKFGHRYVDVYENWQLIEYAAGILNYLGVVSEEARHITVHFYIVQPRNYNPEGPVRSWSIKASDLRSYFDILSTAEHKSFQPAAGTSPSKHCVDCSAKHACRALQETNFNIIDISQHNTPMVLNAQQIGPLLKNINQALERLEALQLGLSEQAISLIKNGTDVPYFTVQHSVGRDRWTKPAGEIVTLGQLFGLDLKKPVEAITPKQAIKQGMPEDVIKSYYEVPAGSAKLVEVKDAKKIFNKGA